jgi:alpha-L-fucosidase
VAFTAMAKKANWNGDTPPTSTGASEKDYQWWRDARFGFFIHWGPGAFVHANSVSWERPTDRPDWAQLGYMADHKKSDELSIEDVNKYYKQYRSGGKNGIPSKSKIYNSLYKIFNPVKFNADEIAQMAVDAGAGYVVLTTKHHDGFCMWDSKYTDYDIMSTPFKRDICKELSDACHKRGIRVLWYYSKVDMHDARYDVKKPKPYEDYLYNQIEELMTKYAPVEGIWWDGGRLHTDNVRIFNMMNRIHPGTISNGRVGRIPYGISFGCPEQRMGAFLITRPWETCAVIGGCSWIWNGGNDVKSTKNCLQMLIGCVVGDGNLLLNFGPEPDGTIPPAVKKSYLGMGRFLKKYGKSIYKTRGGPYKPGRWGGSTRRGKTVYLHITERWPVGVLELPPLPCKVLSCEALTGGKPECTQSADKLVIKLDPKYHSVPDTIIKLTLDKDAMEIKPIPTPKERTLVTNAKVTASSSTNARCRRGAPEAVGVYSFESGEIKKEFGEVTKAEKIDIDHSAARKLSPEEEARIHKMIGKVHRGHFWRFWKPKAEDKKPWIELDLGEPVTFSKLEVRDLYGQVRGFELQAFENGEWRVFFKGEELNTMFLHLAKPVTAARVRLVILGNNGEVPSITLFDLFK